MSNEQKHTNPSTNNKPFMLGYTVTPIGDGKRSAWSKIAAAWAHKDGEGYEVRMDALPVDGRLVLRTVKDDQHDGNDVVADDPVGPT